MNQNRNKNTKVLIPDKGCYTQKRGLATYVMRIANKTWNKDNNTRVQPIINMIGRVCDDDIKYMIPNSNYFSFYLDNFDSLISNDDNFSDTFSYGAYYLINNALVKTGCINSIVSTFGEENAKKIVAFCIYEIIEESNKASNFESFAYDNYTSLTKNISGPEWSTFFKKEINELLIEKFTKEWIKEWSKNCFKKDINKKTIVCLDSTNITTSSPSIDNAEYGHPKKNDGYPQVNTAVFLSEATSHPLAMYQYRGSQIDNTTINELYAYAKSIGLEECFFIADRGYHSQNNIKILLNTKFALMCSEVNDTTKEVILNNHNILNQSQYRIPDFNAYCKSFTTESFYGIKLRVFIYCDGDRQALEIKHLNENIDRYENFINKKKVYEDWMSIEYSKYFTFEKREPTINNKRDFIIRRNHDNIQKEMDKCGFFVVLTNDFDIQHSLMLTSMRNKYKVELNFRQHKTDFDNEKARIQSDEVLLSKTFISFISSIIKFELLYELEPFLHNPKYSSYTLNSVLGTMNKLEIRKNGEVWKPTKRLTGRQETILKTAKLDQNKLFKTISQIKR